MAWLIKKKIKIKRRKIAVRVIDFYECFDVEILIEII